MRRLLLLSLLALAGCGGGGGGGPSKPVKDAEALVRKSARDSKIKFDNVQAVGEAEDGKVCGYFYRPNPMGGTDAVRFITFNDGNEGANPYIDQPSADFPQDKTEFADSWQECVKAGYKDPNAPDPADKPKKKKKKKKS